MVEGLLAVIAVTLIVGVGFYVVNESKQDNQAQTSENSRQTTTKSAAKQTEYIEFKELGFKIKKTSEVGDFTYKANPEVPKFLYAHSGQYSQFVDTCRVGQDFNNPASDPTDKSFAAFGATEGTFQPDGMSAAEQPVKQFDTFYVTLGFPNGSACGGGQPEVDASKLRSELIKKLESALKNAEKL